jgi:hypothetical protein
VNWRQVSIIALALIILPTIAGVLFGVTNALWRGFVSTEFAFWVRQACIGIGVFLLFCLSARRIRSRPLSHMLAAFAIAEVGTLSLVLATDGPIASTLAWTTINAALAVLAHLISRQR